MGQTWEPLLFAHWPVPAAALRPAVPPQLPLDEHSGSAWIAVTPFVVRAVRPRGVPLGMSFCECNVRTYTTLDGRPGIHFFSLDAASLLAVAGARLTYRLPYFPARMRAAGEHAEVAYASERRRGPPAALAVRYGPTGPAFNPRAGTLEHFLTERYCLYALGPRHRVLRAEIHHPPWSLQPARATFERNTMTLPAGIEPSGEPLLHYAERQDVVVWPPRRAR